MCPSELTCSPITSTCELASSDAMPVPPDTMFCFGTAEVTGCVAEPPADPFDIPSNVALTLDTDDAASCALVIGSDPGLCVKLASTVTIAGVLRAQGTRPLVLVAASTVTITGLIDVASRGAQPTPGAGANPGSCVAGTPAETHAGGSGGSFGGKGGNGNLGIEPAVGGVAADATSAIVELRGGCPGDDGAAAVAGIAPGAGANGGGAIFVIASTSITLSGGINASGAGGGGCQSNCGGGGGGSGGMIGLEAPQITVTGEVFANGGGGGEGSQASTARPGGESSAAATAAPGGTGGSCGSDGGPGAQGATLNGGDGVVATCTNSGGGGGGGGAGVIRIHGALTNEGVVSPPATD